VTAAAPGQAAYEAWHAKLAEHHPVVLALRKPQPWDLLSAEVRAEWEAAATAAVAAYIELNGADPVDARAVIAEALAPQPYDVTWATGLAAREPDAADGGDWWVCDGPLTAGGIKILGPFQSRELALDVRSHMEKAQGRTDLWVDDEERPEPQPAPETTAPELVTLIRDILAPGDPWGNPGYRQRAVQAGVFTAAPPPVAPGLLDGQS
jgi:hypothetical protein